MSLKRTLWRKLRTFLPTIGEALAAPSIKQALIDQEIRALLADIRERTPDNPALHGFKVYSQADEDGIIEPAKPSPASPPICNRSRRLMPSQRVRRVPRIRSMRTVLILKALYSARLVCFANDPCG